MINLRSSFSLVAAYSFFSGSLSAATLVYDESQDGDLSDNWQNPTPLVLGIGSLVLNAGLSGGSGDLDIFTITVQPGAMLTELNILSYGSPGDQTSPTSNVSFLGVQPGNQLSQNPIDLLDQTNVFADPINFILFGQDSINTTFPSLSSLVVGPPLSGLNPLPAGDYTFILNETGAASEFSIEFVAVPEPSSGILLALATCALAGRRKRSFSL